MCFSVAASTAAATKLTCRIPSTFFVVTTELVACKKCFRCPCPQRSKAGRFQSQASYLQGLWHCSDAKD
jgi:hypothetical protein